MMVLLLYQMMIEINLTHQAQHNKMINILQQTHFLWPQQLSNLSKAILIQYIPGTIVQRILVMIAQHSPLPVATLYKIKNCFHKIVIVSV